MNIQEFRNSLSLGEPPEGLNPPLAGLWWDAKGNWTKAHEFAQQDEGPAGAWVHAYLHRKEGDSSNAAYWYRKSRKRSGHKFAGATVARNNQLTSRQLTAAARVSCWA